MAKGLSSVAPLILIPITLDYLGAETYGIWMAVTAVTSMFLWADLGLGNTLMTRLTPLVVAGRWGDARILISSAYRILGAVALAASPLLLAAYELVPWGRLLNAPDANNAARIASVCLFAFVLNIPLSLVHRVLFALQRVSASNWVQMLGSMFAVACGALAVVSRAEPLAVIVAVVFAPVVVNAVSTVLVLGRSELQPALGLRGPVARGFLMSGLRFVLIGVMTSVALNVDYLIVAHGAGVEQVARYSVVARLFTALGLLVTVMNMPLWPANAEALARGDRVWVRRTTTRMMLVSGGSVFLFGSVLAVAKDPVVGLLAGEQSRVSGQLVWGFVALWTLFALASPLFMVQNAVGRLGPQSVGWAIFLCASIPAKVLIVANKGVDAIPWTAFVLYGVTVLPSACVGYKIALSESGRPTIDEHRVRRPGQKARG